MQFLPFALLALSIVLVWIPRSKGTPRTWTYSWLIALFLSVAWAIYARVLEPSALISMSLIGLFWRGSGWRSWHPMVRATTRGTAVAMALALALHAMPGFRAVPVFGPETISLSSVPYVLRFHFDKGYAGLMLLVFMCRRAEDRKAWRSVLEKSVPIALLTVASVLVAGVLTRYLVWDPKWLAVTPVFVVANLFFVCVAEEAFFRGVVLEWMLDLTRLPRCGPAGAVVLSAIVFGMVHYAGGLMLVCFATLLGVGCGWAYLAAGRRIEAPILVHFGLNAAHFLLFSYPRI